jgi:hypothetical protein
MTSGWIVIEETRGVLEQVGRQKQSESASNDGDSSSFGVTSIEVVTP